VQFAQQLKRRIGQSKPHRRFDIPVPRAEEKFAETLSSPLGRHHRIGPPCGVELAAPNRQTNRHGRVVTDYGRSFAHHPDQGRTVRFCGIAPVLPVPAQTAHRRGIGAEDATIQSLDAPLIFGAITIDVGHRAATIEFGSADYPADSAAEGRA